MPQSGENRPVAQPLDYDERPERFLTGRAVVQDYVLGGDIHRYVAERFVAERFARVLDVGCGDGELGRQLAGSSCRWIGLDLSPTLLARAPAPVVRGHAAALPFPDRAFDGVAALWMLYHLAEPGRAVVEAFRVLRPGGLLAACAPSRYDSPELSDLLPSKPPSTFDAEVAPALLEDVFPEVEEHAWDAPLLRLPDPDALRRYLVGRGVDPASAAELALTKETPVAVTKRGVLLYGRRPR
jgi:SAM-dependent methyltransferase